MTRREIREHTFRLLFLKEFYNDEDLEGQVKLYLAEFEDMPEEAKEAAGFVHARMRKGVSPSSSQWPSSASSLPWPSCGAQTPPGLIEAAQSCRARPARQRWPAAELTLSPWLEGRRPRPPLTTTTTHRAHLR